MRGMSLAQDAIDFFFLLRRKLSLSVAFLLQLAAQYHMDHKSFVRSEFLTQTDNVQSAFTVYDNITKGNCVSFIFFSYAEKDVKHKIDQIAPLYVCRS